MRRDIARWLVMVALALLLAIAVGGCGMASSGIPALPSPSAVPDPHPNAGVA